MAKKRRSSSKIIWVILFGLVIAGVFAFKIQPNIGQAALDAARGKVDAWLEWANGSKQQVKVVKQEPIYKFAVFADSHEDTVYFPHIVDQIASRTDLAFVAFLGDVSNAGDTAALKSGKEQLDKISVPVYIVPGDHDLNWFPNHDLVNFKQVFNISETTYSITYGQEQFIFIDNSDLNKGIDAASWSKIEAFLEQHRYQTMYAFASTPLSNPYLSFKSMGSQNDQVKAQAKELGQLLKQYQIRAIFAGDTHTFSEYVDKDSGIPTITVGASGSNKNTLPLYVIVEIFEDGSYNVASIPYGTAIPVKGDD